MHLPVSKSKMPSRFDPFSLRKATRRLMYEPFLRPLEWFENNSFFPKSEWGWVPSTDISETEKHIKIKMDVPNVKPENISVEVDKGSVIIRGKSQEETEEEGETWYRVERESGEFCRTFDLPGNVDLDRVRAETQDGILMVTLPKLAADKQKKIKVTPSQNK